MTFIHYCICPISPLGWGLLGHSVGLMGHNKFNTKNRLSHFNSKCNIHKQYNINYFILKFEKFKSKDIKVDERIVFRSIVG